ncbi:MAG TPA: hypothetical protein VJ252_06380, partial [Chthoniobacterales bacterium]|nr:hypothetical protein [Chthoniobacterales bacterium]
MKRIWFAAKTALCSAVICSEILLGVAASAQNAERVAQREVARRKAAWPQGEDALARAQAAMRERNFTLAHQEFRNALIFLPDAVTSGKSHDEAMEGFCRSGVKLAEQRIA